jgi:tetratricopeptide (TPR) repeat protein
MNERIFTPDKRIRIFLSSRIPEFTAERHALVRMIQKMGYTPVFFEETARPHPPRDLYSAYLRQSHIFVAIYGTGYGWIDTAAGMTISGIEDEWNISTGMPRLVFVKETDQPRDVPLEALMQTVSTAGIVYKKFKTQTELVAAVRAAIALHISEEYLADDKAIADAAPDLAGDLGRALAGHPVVTTEFLGAQLGPAVLRTQRVFVQGEPGMGKTVALYQLAQRQPRAFYLSLRNQSALSVLQYFCNRLAAAHGQVPHPVASVGAAKLECEKLLQQRPSLLLVDDVDQAPDVAGILAGLFPGTSRFVFAGRTVPIAFRLEYTVLSCPGFSRAEGQRYIVADARTPSNQEFEALDFSKGNPLYLRYYLESEAAAPVPTLAGYHATMWEQLAPAQKELAAVCALSEVPLKLAELAQALGHYRRATVSGIRVNDELASMGQLLSVRAGTIRVFHPAFRDFIVGELEKKGLSADAHLSLAEAFTPRPGGFLRIVHLARGGKAGDVRAGLLRTAVWAELTGRHSVARFLVAHAVRQARRIDDVLTIGNALQMAALLQEATRNLRSALFSAELAEKVLLRLKNPHLHRIAAATKATFLVEVGRGDEAVSILQSLVTYFNEAGDSVGEAIARMNLGFIYVRRGRMNLVAEQCRAAIAIFEVNGDKWGIAVATLNMQNYYVATSDRENLVRCFTRLLLLSNELDAPRLRMGAYNGMVIYYRRLKKPKQAQAISLKAIALARHHGLWEVETINLGNLGNAYRDEGDLVRARESYEASLKLAEARGSKHGIAFGYEHLASVHADEGDLPGAFELADRALELWRELGNPYREANTENDKAGWYADQGKDFEAAKCRERAAHAWIRSGLDETGLHTMAQALRHYLAGRYYGEAVKCFETMWAMFGRRSSPGLGLLVLDALVPIEHQFIILLDLARIFGEAALLFDSGPRQSQVIEAITAVAAACKNLRAEIGEPIYRNFLIALAGDGITPGTEAGAAAFAFAIEQAPAPVIAHDAFREACQHFTQPLPDLRYLNDTMVGERWTLILPATQAPAVCLVVAGDAVGVRAAVAIAALLMWSRRATIVRDMGRRRWRRLAANYSVFPAVEAAQHGISLPDFVFNNETPAVASRRTDPSDESIAELPIFIHEDFLQFADRIKFPENRCSVLVFCELHSSVLRDFSHGKIRADHLGRFRRELICDLFGLRLRNQPEAILELNLGEDEIDPG